MDTRHWAFKPILLFVSIGSFIISWIFTCNLLASMATTGFATVIAFGLATVLEPAKITFFALGTTQRDLMALIVGIILTLLSIIGTLGWLQVQHAEKVAISMQESAGFKGLQSQISGMDAQIANIQNAASALPTNYHSRRQQLLDEANTMLAQKNELTQQLANYKPTTGEASSALFVALGKFFGGIDPTLIELWINATYGILLELVAIISGVYVFKNSGTYRSTTISRNARQDDPNYQAYQQFTADVNPRLQSTTVNYSQQNNDQPQALDEPDQDDDIEFDDISDLYPILPRYVDGLFSKVGQGGRLEGRRTVADKVGLSHGQADRCHKFLKDRGLIQVKGNATFATIPKANILSRIDAESEVDA